ncbi:MAG: metal ABC transporter permease [Bacteroidales bacterium]|nr:metal ABC transporter permease [Bacteroidales bacterium]
MLELFQYEFFTNALLAAILTSITCGIMGTYIVAKRIVFISGGITHTSFGGIGLGYFLSINPILGAAVFSILSALGIEYLSKKSEVREDSAIAIMWAFGMAVGIIFIFLTPGYAPNLISFLFGSILTVTQFDLIIIFVLALLISLFFLIFYKTILFVAFDEEFIRTRNIPANLINYILISLVALTIVLSIKVAGIILVISLVTIPPATANIFVKDFKKIIFFSIIFGLTGSLIGLLLSYFLNIPSGATIVFIQALIFIILRIVKSIQNQLT